MRPNVNIEKVLERSFPSASTEQVESARDRIYERLRDSAENPGIESLPLPSTSLWRWSFAVAAASAAALLVAVTIWRGMPTAPYATVQPPEGSIYRSVAGKMIPMHTGEQIEIGDVVRSSDSLGGAIVLAD